MKDENELSILKSIQTFNKLDPQCEFKYLNILVGPKAQILDLLNPAPSLPQ